MTPELALALCGIGALSAALQALTLLVASWMRGDTLEVRRDVKALVARVGEHDGIIAAFKMDKLRGVKP